MKIIFSIAFIFFNILEESNMKISTISKDDPVKIIFWKISESEFDTLKETGHEKFLEEDKVIYILTDKYISKYYWEEQIFEIEYDKIKEETGEYFPYSYGFFTIMLNNKILCHGLNRLTKSARKNKYDDYSLPTIVELGSIDSTKMLIALKPYYLPIDDIFREYSKQDQKKLLDELGSEVYNHFKEAGKMVEGKVDLKKILSKESASWIKK